MARASLFFSNALTVTVVLILLLNVGVKPVAGQIRRCNIQGSAHPLGVCGSALTDMLQFACSTLMSSGKVKRNVETDQDDPLRDVRLSSQSALSYLTKRERNTNIVCECCMKQCHWGEIIQYC